MKPFMLFTVTAQTTRYLQCMCCDAWAQLLQRTDLQHGAEPPAQICCTSVSNPRGAAAALSIMRKYIFPPCHASRLLQEEETKSTTPCQPCRSHLLSASHWIQHGNAALYHEEGAGSFLGTGACELKGTRSVLSFGLPGTGRTCEETGLLGYSH